MKQISITEIDLISLCMAFDRGDNLINTPKKVEIWKAAKTQLRDTIKKLPDCKCSEWQEKVEIATRSYGKLKLKCTDLEEKLSTIMEEHETDLHKAGKREDKYRKALKQIQDSKNLKRSNLIKIATEAPEV